MSNNKLFNTVMSKSPKHSYFDLSFENKLSTRMGRLVPFYCAEVVPGDKFNISTETLLRMMPLIAPVMHKVNVYQHFFFVPNRILWPNWEKFISTDTSSEDSPAFPLISDIGNPITVADSSLADYLGLPSGFIKDDISALPFAAYQRIWYEYYRDQNLQASYDENLFTLHDGLQDPAVLANLKIMRNRAWEHDYFTSALPWAQKGDAINIPLSIAGLAEVHLEDGPTWNAKMLQADLHTPPFAGNLKVDGTGDIRDDGANMLVYDPNGSLYVDGSDFTDLEGTINDLRTAMTLQRWLEKNARGGTRYIEIIKHHFGVTSSDKRLQRPEYLGGSKSPMVISEVLQTSESNETPQANMSGHGVSVGASKKIKYYAEEHGYIIGIMSIMPTTAYQQGIDKHFFKFDKFDYLWPDFAHLGEQAILKKEVYYSSEDTPEQNDEVFGYIPRYSEYRFRSNKVSGVLRDSLSFWHLGRIFGNRPQLNELFIRADPSNRIFAVEDPNNDNIVAHIYVKEFTRRALPKYGTPLGL